MTDKLKAIYQKHREIIAYIIFGGLTTLVNFIFYYTLVNPLHVHYLAAQVIAWIAAVLFAYFVNKRYVFDSKSTEKKTVAVEIISFFAVRVLSFLVESAILILLTDILLISENISKIPASVITVILNYLTGKFIVFRKNKK
jgi:Predicted membrane protein